MSGHKFLINLSSYPGLKDAVERAHSLASPEGRFGAEITSFLVGMGLERLRGCMRTCEKGWPFAAAPNDLLSRHNMYRVKRTLTDFNEGWGQIN